MLTRAKAFVSKVNPFSRSSRAKRNSKSAPTTSGAAGEKSGSAAAATGATAAAASTGEANQARPAPPANIKAVTITSAKGGVAVTTVPLPKLRDDYVLVKVSAVAVNPTDWKSAAGPPGKDPTGCRVGCDYAGIVEKVGPNVTKSFKPGDRIAGAGHGANAGQPEDGVFAEYAVVKGDVQIVIPESLSNEEAATLGIGISTVGQGLYQELGLPLPSATGTTAASVSPPESATATATQTPLLIYGGSTATGILGIQFAKLSGCRVATTCSPRNFDYVKSLGADAAFDYSEEPAALAAKIRDFFGATTTLRLAWDCIASPESAKLCASVLAKEGESKYRSLLRVDPDIFKQANPAVDSSFTFMYTIFGEGFEKFGQKHDAKPKDAEFAKMFWELARELLASGKIRTAKTEVNRGGSGLEGVMEGMKELKEGKVSATKLVYTL